MCLVLNLDVLLLVILDRFYHGKSPLTQANIPNMVCFYPSQANESWGMTFTRSLAILKKKSSNISDNFVVIQTLVGDTFSLLTSADCYSTLKLTAFQTLNIGKGPLEGPKGTKDLFQTTSITLCGSPWWFQICICSPLFGEDSHFD